MQAAARCAIVGLLAVMLGSCAWQPTPFDHPHVPSEMAYTAASDTPKCQSPDAPRQPAMAGQRILVIRGLTDYMPSISPMTSLKARLANEGYDVTMITHMTDGFYKNQYWDAVIGHSQGAIDALRDAPDLARYNPHVTIIAVDPPRTSVLFQCVPDVRYLDLHTGEFGLGGGSLSCPQAQNLAMAGCTSRCRCGQTHKSRSWPICVRMRQLKCLMQNRQTSRLTQNRHTYRFRRSNLRSIHRSMRGLPRPPAERV